MKTTAQTPLGLILTLTLMGSLPLLAESIQVSDLRLPAEAYPENFFFFDNGFSIETREVAGSPVQLSTSFSGVSQVGVNPAGSLAFDFFIRNFAMTSAIRNFNRFAADRDGDGPEGGAREVSGYQFALDLQPLENFLGNSGETLTTLDLRLLFDLSDTAPPFDLYLSYASSSEGLSLTPLSADPGEIYSDLWLPAQTLNEGDVVNGTHRILRKQTSGDQDFTESILALYQDGVRQVNLVIVSGGFFANIRQLVILGGAGLMVGTDGVPDAELVADFRLDRGLFGNEGMAYDQIIDSPTRPAGGFLEVPVLFTGISQNQGGNESNRLNGLAYWDIDGINGSTGSSVPDNQTAIIAGHGAAGIGVGSSDAFQFTAWQSSGDFDVLVTLDDLITDQENAQAGLMVRSGSGVDAAHVFIGMRSNGMPGSGDLVVVVREDDGGDAVETLGNGVQLPLDLRIRKVGDSYDLFFSRDDTMPADVSSVELTLSEPALVGFACTSGSDVVEEDAVATFKMASVVLPDPGSDIGLQTSVDLTTLRQVNRFRSETEIGIAQWAIDLTPLETYLANNAIDPSAIELRLLADISANGEATPVDIYLSYENLAESIMLSSLIEGLATNVNIASQHYQRFFAPAIDAEDGDIVNGTHRVVRAAGTGDISLSEDLLSLYQSGVREFNLLLTTNQFFANRDINILEGSGVFIQSGSAERPVVSESRLVGNMLDLTVENLVPGESYHVRTSTDLTGFVPVMGSEKVAGNTMETFSVSVDPGTDPTQFLIVVEGTIVP